MAAAAFDDEGGQLIKYCRSGILSVWLAQAGVYVSGAADCRSTGPCLKSDGPSLFLIARVARRSQSVKHRDALRCVEAYPKESAANEARHLIPIIMKRRRRVNSNQR